MSVDIALGSEVRCRITGFTGIATARLEYLDGSVDIAVTPQKAKDSYPKAEYINAHRLEVISEGLSAPPQPKSMGFRFPDAETPR